MTPTRCRPRWLVPALESWYSRLDCGDRPRLLGPHESLFGTNLSVRRQLALELGGFAPELGRVQRRLISGEDTEFQWRLRCRGAAVGTRRERLSGTRSPAGGCRPRGWSGEPTPRDEQTCWLGAGTVAAGVFHGWRDCARRIATSDNRAGAAMREAVRRSRCLGDGFQTLAIALDGHPLVVDLPGRSPSL